MTTALVVRPQSLPLKVRLYCEIVFDKGVGAEQIEALALEWKARDSDQSLLSLAVTANKILAQIGVAANMREQEVRGFIVKKLAEHFGGYKRQRVGLPNCIASVSVDSVLEIV